MIRTTSTMAATNEVLLIPHALASEVTIGGLNAPSLRLAVVLTTLAFHGPNGEWSIVKPDLELRAGVVLDNASKLLEPLRAAVIEKGEETAPLFDVLEYEPGARFKSAGVIKVRLTFLAREMLYSQHNTVRLPIDELRTYSTAPGIILRLRLAARMQDVKSSQFDEWRLKPQDFPRTSVFGSYASLAIIRRQNAAGEETSYISLSRAETKLLKKGILEINTRSKGVQIDIVPIRTGSDRKSRWLAIELQTRRIHAGKAPLKPKLSDLNKRQKQPAIAR